MIADLRAASAEFAHYRDEMQVEPMRSTDKTLTHLGYGRFDVRCDVTHSATTGNTLLVMRPRIATGTAERFRSLESTRRQQTWARSGSSQATPSQLRVEVDEEP